MVSLLILMMESKYSLSNNDSLLYIYTKEIEQNQNNSHHIDSLMLFAYDRYNNLNPEFLGELAVYLEKLYFSYNSRILAPWYHYYKGYFHYYSEEYTEALYNFEESLTLFRESKHNLMIAYTYNMLGLTYYKNSNNKIAIEYFTKSLNILDLNNYTSEQFKPLANIGIIYFEIDPVKSIEYLLASLKIIENQNDELKKLQIYLALTRAYIEIKDYETAQNYLSISERINSSINNVSSESRILLYKAQIFQHNGDFYNALKIFNFLDENSTKYRRFNTRLNLTVNHNIADIKYLKNDYQGAIDFYYKSLVESVAQNIDVIHAKVYEGLSKSYSKINKIDSAIKYFDLFTETKSKISSKLGNQVDDKLLFDYELNKKEIDIQKVLLENKKQENQFKNFIIIAAGLIIVVLLILITFYYKSFKRNYSLSLKLQSEIEQNEKFKIELIEAKMKIEETDNFKSAIIRNMTHEIRTPFNGLLGFVSLMRKRSTELDDEELIEYSELVELSGRRVYELVSNLNDLALLESNDYQLHFGLSYLPDIINEVYFQYINSASNKGIEIRVSEIDDIVFETDSVALSKALKNVVDNAIKFTSSGFVSIETKQILGNLEIIVQDSGIGISEEHILNIGMPFKQVDMSISRSYEGMGIGLAVTKKIIQKLNGEMTVVSETTKGTKVIFTLNQIIIQNDILQDEYLENN